MKLLTTLTYSGIYFDDEELNKAKRMNFSSTVYSIENFASMLNLIFKFFPGTNKYYAVKSGRICGIFFSKKEYRSLIDGYKNPVHKSCNTIEEAIEFVQPETYERHKAVFGNAFAFTDGSYNVRADKYGYGVVLCFDNQTLEFSGSGEEPEKLLMKNISGEIEAAKTAINEAIKREIKELIIYYDFEGVEKWATGAWKIKKKYPAIAEYYQFIQDSAPQINVTFKKVKAHSGVLLNSRADKLAKVAVGVRK